jgi:hypothetical protein
MSSKHRKTKNNSHPQQSPKFRPLFDVAVLTAGKVDLFEKCLASIFSEIEAKSAKVYVVEQGVSSEGQLVYDAVYRKYSSDFLKVIRLRNNAG